MTAVADDGTAATVTCACGEFAKTVTIGDKWAGRVVGTIDHARRAARAAGTWHRIVQAQLGKPE